MKKYVKNNVYFLILPSAKVDGCFNRLSINYKRRSAGISMGDPAGIGPEIILQSIPVLNDIGVNSIIFGSFFAFLSSLKDNPSNHGIAIHSAPYNEKTRIIFEDGGIFIPRVFGKNKVNIFVNIDNDKYADSSGNVIEHIVKPGVSDNFCGMIAFESMKITADAASKDKIGCIVTAPLSKSSVSKSMGIEFTGHTGWLSSFFGKSPDDTGMMFHTKEINVSLVTVHEPLSEIPSLITKKRIIHSILLTVETLKSYFRIANPQIGVIALNPHAGENGLLGSEEREIIEPAISEVSASGLKVYGPFPADTIFRKNVFSSYDAIVAMYHDQALAPIKALYPFGSVNLTMGLPVVRTSPDHGTAFDIAGTGRADPSGFIEAVTLAVKLSESKTNNSNVKGF